MWLGTAQQLTKVLLDDVPVLSSQLRVVDTARNLTSLLIVNCQCLHMLQQHFVAATTSCGNCGHSRDAWRTKPLKHRRMRSSVVDWITVMHCIAASPADTWTVCIISPERRCSSHYRFMTAGTQHLSCGSSTDCRFVSMLCSSWWRWSTAPLQEQHRSTCPTSVTLRRTAVTFPSGGDHLPPARLHAVQIRLAAAKTFPAVAANSVLSMSTMKMII